MIELPLSRGLTATIDDIDADLAGLKWCADKAPHKPHFPFYARRKIQTASGMRANEHLHRVILSRILCRPLSKGEFVDHINSDGLLNVRSNLRLATASQNTANAGKLRNNTSGFKGVSFDTKASKWRACIKVNGKTRHLGFFDNIIDAAKIYDLAAIACFKEFARTNDQQIACGSQEAREQQKETA